MIVDWDDLMRLTEQRMANPQVGDLFHEMYSFWVRVVRREGSQIKTRESWPNNEATWTGTVEEFKKRFEYGTIPGYSIVLYL